MFVVAVAACIVCGYYADIQPVLGEAVKPLIYISVGFGIVMVGLILSVIIRGFKK